MPIDQRCFFFRLLFLSFAFSGSLVLEIGTRSTYEMLGKGGGKGSEQQARRKRTLLPLLRLKSEEERE